MTTSTKSASSGAGPALSESRLRKGPGDLSGPRLPPVSRDAQRLAAAILEVLAGQRTPTQAAAALGMNVPRYYLWEQRALEGLVRACEPRPLGKAASQRHRMAALEKEIVRLRQECARQQALARASQRTLGLAAPPPSPAKAPSKPGSKPSGKAAGPTEAKAKRKRRPVVRALKVAAALRASTAVPENPPDSSSANEANVLQRSPHESLSTAAGPITLVPAAPET